MRPGRGKELKMQNVILPQLELKAWGEGGGQRIVNKKM
jgi:hypothetical protein